MKIRYINNLLIFAVIIAGACAESSPVPLIIPPNDLPPTAQETFAENIDGTWNVAQNGSVLRDNVDVSDQFTSFVLSFDQEGAWTSVGGGDLWPDGEGTWSFVSETGAAPFF